MGKGQPISTTKQEFLDKYSGYAMQLQQMYGIPSSVILAQMAVESGWGTSGNAKEANNFFGVKAGKTWKGPVRNAWDDEDKKSPFRIYATWQDSINDYARLLMTSRYNWCCKYDSTDHSNWIKGIRESGYCTDKAYVEKIEATIRANGLDRFDRQAVADAQAKGITIGYKRGFTPEIHAGNVVEGNVKQTSAYQDADLSKRYAFPIDGDIVVTSGYGNRSKPNAMASSSHQALDIKADHTPVFATEDKGRVIAVNENAALNSGKYVKVRYDRSDGTRYDVTYMHLNEIVVRTGDEVNAHQKIGVSGNTGNTTGPHLHFAVMRYTSDGKAEKIDPSRYLAEIAVLGGIHTSVTMRGSNKELLAEYKSQIPSQQPQRNDNDLNLITEAQRNQLAERYGQVQMRQENDFISQLMSQNPSDGHGDFISEMLSMAFSAVVALAIQLDHGEYNDDVVQEELAQDQARQVVNAQGANAQGTNTQYVIDRSKDISAKQAAQEASLAFDKEYPENQQTTGVRLT